MKRLLIPALIGSAAVPGYAGTIALTFDDLPVFGGGIGLAEAQSITHGLLAGFRRHHWPVTGFVNEIQLEGTERPERTALLTAWVAAGMDLGNHSYSHVSLTTTPVANYIADVARGETVTKALLARHGRRERWYRHPYLETGATQAARDRFEDWLAAHGYRVAPVTAENSDWMFANPYADDLRRGDTAAAARVRQQYLAFTDATLAWYRSAAHGLLGREPALIMLLHASRLNSDSIDGLDAVLVRNHLHPVSLDRAMRDPAYRIPDHYIGPDGNEWLTRWAMTLHRDLPYATLPQVPADVQAAEKAYEAVNGDR